MKTFGAKRQVFKTEKENAVELRRTRTTDSRFRFRFDKTSERLRQFRFGREEIVRYVYIDISLSCRNVHYGERSARKRTGQRYHKFSRSSVRVFGHPQRTCSAHFAAPFFGQRELGDFERRLQTVRSGQLYFEIGVGHYGKQRNGVLRCQRILCGNEGKKDGRGYSYSAVLQPYRLRCRVSALQGDVEA